MKKTLALALVVLLTLSLLTACGGSGSGNGSDPGGDPGGGNSGDLGGGNGGSSGSGNNPDNNISSASDDDYGDYDDHDDDTSKPIKIPDITVNPGDTVFDNDIITIVYEEVQVDDPSTPYPQMSIICYATRNTDKEINVHTDEQFVINGLASGIYDPGFKQFTVSRSDYLYTFISMKSLEEKGISVEDIKTVQITFTVKDYETDYVTDDVLFEGTALFNIELP